VTAPDLRLRRPSPAMIALPWERALGEWDPAEVPLRELPVGPSRHLVRFVEVDGELWALKELPPRIARREFDVLRHLEATGLPAVRPAGLVTQPDHDCSILLTHYLSGSWQYRRLIARLPPNRPAHRARLFDAMVGLLVELHRHGVYWGDCSLANTLFSRDGQLFQAWLVDAETSEVHPSLSDGQRAQDLDILVENVASGMVDLAASLGRPPEIDEQLIAEAADLPARYEALWEVLHTQPQFAFGDRYRIEGTVRELNDLGYVVDEVSLAPAEGAKGSEGTVRLRVMVGERNHHARYLRELTGLDAGEGQARILLGDLRAHQRAIARDHPYRVGEGEAIASWLHDVLTPGMRRAHAAVRHRGTAIQAYCDLLEVRWLLSEQEGADVGTDRALEALAERAPTDSAARALVADTASAIPAVDSDPGEPWPPPAEH
jgi:tRNA A-37 threonylcarbamoyl transferase component Bud32